MRPPARSSCGRLKPPAEGGPPARSPLHPLLRFVSTRGVPRAAARGQGSAPGPRPLFCKKAGQKTFKRQSTSSPSPSPLGRVIQSVREADTLAAEWHLPREWERRGGPETSRGRHPPKRFSLGLHPVSLGKHQRNGVEQAAQFKNIQKTYRRVPETHPWADLEPRPYRSSGPPTITPSSRQRGGKRRSGGGVSGAAGR